MEEMTQQEGGGANVVYRCYTSAVDYFRDRWHLRRRDSSQPAIGRFESSPRHVFRFPYFPPPTLLLWGPPLAARPGSNRRWVGSSVRWLCLTGDDRPSVIPGLKARLRGLGELLRRSGARCSDI